MPRPQHPFTTHGISRAGDEYQDLWGIELLLEWLEHPGRYDWVRFECDDVGALDDVVARRREGGLVCRQMKHTPEPERADLAASWDWLTAQRRGANGPLRSLLQHWAEASDRVVDGQRIVEDGLFTNRVPHPDLRAALVGVRVDLDRIAAPAVRRMIEDQLGGADRARAFFERFDFHLDLQSYDAFEQSLKERFRRSLGGDDAGWASLRAAARDWALRKDRAGPGGRIALEDVRRAALWHDLQALFQNFEVPDDYVEPDEGMRDALVAGILQPEAGVFVLAAGPGFGKSTFLSHLTDHLTGQGVPAIRHHYYMAARERAEDRFSHGVVLEALMAQLQRHHASLLGEQANLNPTVDRFAEWLAAAGAAALGQGTKLVVIVDGLDHVWREQGSSGELERLFRVLLPSPAGICVLIGTQPLEDALPERLLRYAPRASWWPLPLLTEVAVRELLRRNLNRLCGAGQNPADAHLLDDAAAAFYRLTSGHPLHLRYSLEALIESGAPAFAWNIDALPACPTGEIGSYYDALCRNIGETARRHLHLFAVTGFPWPPDDLRQVIDPAGLHRDETRTALRSIRHLFQESPLGLVPFHASLTYHLRRVPGHGEYRNELLDQVAGWLAGLAPEPWQWAYRWLVAADRGDIGDLIAGPNEAWLTEAIVARRPDDQIGRILARASRCALTSDDLSRTVELGLLAGYAQQARDSFIYDLTPLTACALQSRRRDYIVREMRARLTALPAREMVALVEAEIGGSGGQALVKACLDEIQARWDSLADRTHASRQEWMLIMEAVPWLLGFWHRTPTEEGVAAVRDAANNGGPGFLAFLAARAKLWRWTDLPEVLALLQEEADRHELAMGAFRHASAAGVDWLGWSDQPEWRQSAMALAACLARRERPAPGLPPLVPWPAPAVDPMVFVAGGRRPIVLDLHRIFFVNLVHAWLDAATPDPANWQEPDRCAMAGTGYEVGRRLAAGEGIDLSAIFPALPRVRRQPDEHFLDTRRRERDLCRASAEIVLDLAVMRGLAGGDSQISEQEIAALMAAPVGWRRSFRDALLDSRLALLSPGALASVLQHERDRLGREVCQLPDRFEDYARLAWVASLHQAAAPEIEGLSALAARCAVGYGHHKDLFLSDIMSGMERAADALPDEVRGWMKRLAPFVDAVNDFTDGDETAHNKVGMGELLLRLAPHLVAPYVRHLAARGDDYRADQLMSIYVAEADLASGETWELLGLAGGEETREALAKRQGIEKRNGLAAGHEPPLGDEWSIQPPAEQLLPPDVTGFPPDRFDEFLSAVWQQYWVDGKAIVLSWFQHWVTCDREGTLRALAQSVDADPLPMRMAPVLIEAFRIVLPVAGREAAFDWLVRAHRAALGWSTYLSPESEAQDVWAELRREYPGRWRDFIQATARFGHGGEESDGLAFIGQSRLVAFLLQMDELEEAAAVLDRQVDVLLRRTADLPLTTPAWVEHWHV